MSTSQHSGSRSDKRDDSSWVLNGNPDEQSDQIAQLVIGMAADRDAYEAAVHRMAVKRGRDRRLAFAVLAIAYALVTLAFAILAAIAVMASASTSQILVAAGASAALGVSGIVFGYLLHRELQRRRELRKEVAVAMERWRLVAKRSAQASPARAKPADAR
jgi:predicted phage tail protein